MPSTWTTSNAIEKIADGEKTDTWGQITNRNFDIIDRAASGVGTVDLSSSGAAHTLYTTDGTVGDALTDGMNKVLVLSGASQACTITISPNDADKFYLIDNNSGHDCTFSQGSGANVTIANGTTGIIYANGAGASAAVTAIIDSTTLTSLGVTATAAELNKLDGATVTTAELNKLSGTTVTTAEINYNDVTTLGTSQASKVVTADANGVVTFDNGCVGDSTALTSSSGVLTLNCRDGNDFTLTLTESITSFTISNPPVSGRDFTFSMKVVQDASASGYTISWPTSVDWPSGTAPTLTSTTSAVDYFIFITNDGGSTFYGFVAGRNLG